MLFPLDGNGVSLPLQPPLLTQALTLVGWQRLLPSWDPSDFPCGPQSRTFLLSKARPKCCPVFPEIPTNHLGLG